MRRTILTGLAITMLLTTSARTDQVMPFCGSAVLTLDEGVAPSLGWVDAYFNDAASRDQTLSLPAPGNALLTRFSGTPGTLGTSTVTGVPGIPGTVQVVDLMRAFGETPSPAPPETYPGVPGVSRSRQVTTLMVDPANILGSWSPSNDAFGIFVGNTTLGEQIAFTGMQRWGGPFTGVLIYGDFALRYAPGRAGQIAEGGTLSGLVLTSNIDFLDSAVADLANATVTSDGRTLRISGDLLISGALFVLDSSAVVGRRFGTLSLTACLARPDVDGDSRATIEDLYTWERGGGLRDVNASGTVTDADRDTLEKVLRCRESEGMRGTQR